MFLIKCQCGCFFTINQKLPVVRNEFTCQSCKKSISLCNSLSSKEVQCELEKAGMTLQVIPDNAKITVSFEA